MAMGDFNIDLLSCNSNFSVDKFVNTNTMMSNSLLPLIKRKVV